MRSLQFLILAVVLSFSGAFIPLAAQENSDTSSDLPDSADAPPPIRRASGGNPYLREVREVPDAPYRRGAYYAGFGLGFGSEAIAELGVPAPYSQSRIRPTLNLSVGAGVGQALRLGLDGFVWFNVTQDGALETVSTLMLAGRIYPLATSGLYFRAAGGFGRYGQDQLDNYCGCSAPITQQFGLAYSLGAGFEVPVSRGLWLGPSVEMIRMNFNGPDGYRERVLNLGLTLTYDGHN